MRDIIRGPDMGNQAIPWNFCLFAGSTMHEVNWAVETRG